MDLYMYVSNNPLIVSLSWNTWEICQTFTLWLLKSFYIFHVFVYIMLFTYRKTSMFITTAPSSVEPIELSVSFVPPNLKCCWLERIATSARSAAPLARRYVRHASLRKCNHPQQRWRTIPQMWADHKCTCLVSSLIPTKPYIFLSHNQLSSCYHAPIATYHFKMEEVSSNSWRTCLPRVAPIQLFC